MTTAFTFFLIIYCVQLKKKQYDIQILFFVLKDVNFDFLKKFTEIDFDTIKTPSLCIYIFFFFAILINFDAFKLESN